MTVSSVIATATLQWTGAETSFTPGFEALEASDVVVVYASGGSTQTMQQGTNYSITLDAHNFVTVIPILLPAAPATLTISRNSTPLQTDAFQDGVPWSAPVIETALDLGALRDQEIRRDLTALATLVGSGGGGGGGPTGPLLAYASRAAFANVSASALTAALVLGFALGGDSAAAAVAKLAAPPASPKAWQFQTLDGGWWQFANRVINPEQIGPIGASDDSATLIAADAAAAALGAQLVIDRPHQITNPVTFTSTVYFAAQGKIKVSAAHQLSFPKGFVAAPETAVFDFSTLYTATGSMSGTPGAAASGFVVAPIPGVALTPFLFGAAGDNSTPDDIAVDAAFMAMFATGAPLDFLSSTFLCSAVKNYNVELRWATGFTIRGNGMDDCGLNFPGVTSGRPFMLSRVWTSGPAIAWLRCKCEGWSINGSLAGPLATFGRDDYNDQVNLLTLIDFGVFNGKIDAANEAVRLNAVYGVLMLNPNFDCYAQVTPDGLTGFAIGTALNIRNGEFVNAVGGSIGNAAYAIAATAGTSRNINVFGVDIENMGFAGSCQSVNAGQINFWGCWVGQWLYNAWSAPASYQPYAGVNQYLESICAIRCHYEPGAPGGNWSQVVVDPSSYIGIVTDDLRAVPTPAMPASATVTTNASTKSIFIRVTGGSAVNTIVLSGVTAASAGAGQPVEAVIPPSASYYITYGTGAAWYHYIIN